jgi:hypothetical protein
MTPTELHQLAADRATHLSALLRALWHDAQGHWSAAHEIAQEVDTPDGARVHAYLHRKEGDTFNSNYWYRRAGHPPFTGPLEAEWTAIVTVLLAA